MRTTWIGALTLTGALALTACGSSASHPRASSATRGSTDQLASVGPNPVEVLKKISGCAIPASVTVGDEMGGVRYASCNVPDPTPGSADGDTITAYTSNDNAALQAELHTQGDHSTDSSKIIVGYRFFLTDTGEVDITNGGYQFVVPPESVANDVSGQLN